MFSPIPVSLAGFALGVVLLQQQARLPASPALIAALGVAATIAAIATGHSRVAVTAAVTDRSSAVASLSRLLMVALCAATCGFGYSATRAELRLADALPAQWEGEDIVVSGVVDELPRNGEQGVRFAFAAETVETAGAVVPRRLSLAWYARPNPPLDTEEVLPAVTPPRVHAGERWRFTVRLARPHGSANPAGFDLEAWLLQNNLRATGYVRPEAESVRVDAFAGRVGDFVERARERIRDRILGSLPNAPYAGVLAALTVGDQRSIPDRQWRVFNRTGVAHLISISGLHVTAFAVVIGGAAFLLLRRFTTLTSRCPARKLAVLVGVIASAFYVALAGAEVPALRTLTMLVVSAAGLWLGKPGTGRLIWLWSLAAVLVADPFAPLAAGFWLSFCAVGVLIYALGSRLPREAATGFARVARSVAEGWRTQWAVTVGLVPLTLALFGQLSLVSPLANAIAIPVVTFLVVPAALGAIVLPIDALWSVAHAVLAALMAFLEHLAQLPDAAWQQHAPLPWSLASGMLGVLLLLAPRGVPGRWLGALWLLPLFVVLPRAPLPGSVALMVVDVGQGLAVIVQTATHSLVYDTGPRYSELSDAGARIVAPALRALGLSRLSGLIVSHRDADHSGGALSLLATVPADWLSSSLDDASPIVAWQRERGVTRRCEAGQSWVWDGVRFSILHPAIAAYAEEGRKSNDLCCVLRIESANGRVLIAGDIEARSESELLARDAEALTADVLIVPHHGSRTSSTPRFIDAVGAKVAIITAGYRNRFGHPRPDIVERYRLRGVDLPRTDLDGAVLLTLDSGGLAVTRWRDHAGRYWQREIPQ